ncbi:MAG: formate dehydrogenase subunit gamma [Ideonella sp.]|nr:formate dehydrogenase subunit gamma [Ideonella sp.]MCC7458734.1 formate dehydrogenase subunit gamma [Nitrospira sp.]
MNGLLRQALPDPVRRRLPQLLFALALACAGAVAPAQTAPAPDDPVPGAKGGGAPPGFVVPADPKPDDTNAQRAKSQPGNNAPLWRGVRESGNVPGVTTLPDHEGATLIQRFVQYPGVAYATAGEAWRQVRNRWIVPYGGALLLIVLVAIAIFYFGKGSLGRSANGAGGRIERFTPLERAAHWVNAAAFVVLAVSGIVIAFGKFFLLPVLGATLFGWLSIALKTAHNFAGPLFAVSVLIVFITFLKDNFPRAGDGTWLKKGGGMLGGQEVPSHRFNAGEKVVFWFGVFALGALVVGSGLVLDQLIPDLAYLRGDMQVAHMIHATAAVLMICLFLGHIYLGTIGVKGAYRAMRHGYVDEAWAHEHHALWAEDIRAGKIPARRSSSTPPAGMQAAKEAT